MMIILLVGTALAGCSSNTEEEAHHAHGDLRVETAAASELPSFLEEKPEDMQLLYTAVGQSQDLLQQIPCYCGCGDSVGHRNNYDCFIYENKDSGAVVWDDHATKCAACLDIAAKAIIDYQDGHSIKEIRENIDAAYEEGYAKPTPTPAVS
ncbi:PCYCGC domain-containing protein [Halobacillus litoralis]|uniref:PCYCGC domain-containing protein n=1 Tax=Halobacillus litoralis TaxID=45668 RepID=UPI001CD61A7D|nr:PCYCGC domain-containing protein [Halobacillus litoralis]MCA0972454.1 PCYCGC domain-containing protein [Halobacillus litoralis]